MEELKTTPCKTCGVPTRTLADRRCNNCWEVETRLKSYLMSQKGREFAREQIREAQPLDSELHFEKGSGSEILISDEETAELLFFMSADELLAAVAFYYDRDGINNILRGLELEELERRGEIKTKHIIIDTDGKVKRGKKQ